MDLLLLAHQLHQPGLAVQLGQWRQLHLLDLGDRLDLDHRAGLVDRLHRLRLPDLPDLAGPLDLLDLLDPANPLMVSCQVDHLHQ